MRVDWGGMWLAVADRVGMKGAARSTTADDASTAASGASEERSESPESSEQGLSGRSCFIERAQAKSRYRDRKIKWMKAPNRSSRATRCALPSLPRSLGPVLASSCLPERFAPFSPARNHPHTSPTDCGAPSLRSVRSSLLARLRRDTSLRSGRDGARRHRNSGRYSPRNRRQLLHQVLELAEELVVGVDGGLDGP
jgi:hypothetical protein